MFDNSNRWALVAHCSTVVVQCLLCLRFSGGLRFFNALHELPNLAVFVGLGIFLPVFHCDNPQHQRP
jgi:hypothetical protein